MSETVIGIITVRTSSTRLPNKCLLPFGDSNMLEHVIRRALFFGIEPIVCTSEDKTDDIVEKIAKKEGVKFFRGSLVNKLKRWSDCAEHFKLVNFHTIDADDPFFDPAEIKKSMRLLTKNGYDMVSPTASSAAGGASVGYSLTAQIVKHVCDSIPTNTDTEMMWFYLEKFENLKAQILPEKERMQFDVRLTLDYIEDYWLLESVRKMVGNFATRKKINELFIRNPDLYKINFFRNQEWKSAQLAKKI